MKKQLEETSTKNVLKTKLEIPKKKAKTQNENKNKPKENTKKNNENKDVNDMVPVSGERSKIKDNVYKNKCKKKATRKEIRKGKENYLYLTQKALEIKRRLSLWTLMTLECENMNQYIEKCLREQDEEQENINPDDNIPFGLRDITYCDDESNELKKDDWLVVKFETKKSVKHFVGTIIMFENEMPVVKFARKVKQLKSNTVTTFTYPIVEDISAIKHREDIVCILPQPIISRRGQITFIMEFNKLNIQ